MSLTPHLNPPTIHPSNYPSRTGTATTKWERFVDEATGQSFWYQFVSGETQWAKPAICHVCDKYIDPEDVRCFSCNASRTRYNMRLYTGISADALKTDLGEKEDEDTFE